MVGGHGGGRRDGVSCEEEMAGDERRIDGWESAHGGGYGPVYGNDAGRRQR